MQTSICCPSLRRYWLRFALPDRVGAVRALLLSRISRWTLVISLSERRPRIFAADLPGGAALGITGFFAYMAHDARPTRMDRAAALMIYVFVAYVVRHRAVCSRCISASAACSRDRLVHRRTARRSDPDRPRLHRVGARRREHRARDRHARALERRRRDEPDRLYDGEWAGLAGVDSWSSRRARESRTGTKGTWVITHRWLVHARRAVRPPDAQRTPDRLSADVANDHVGCVAEGRIVRIAATENVDKRGGCLKRRGPSGES